MSLDFGQLDKLAIKLHLPGWLNVAADEETWFEQLRRG